MSEVELVLVNDTDKCTIYTIQFSEESETEYERFYSKFIKNAQMNQDLLRIVQLIDKIAVGTFLPTRRQDARFRSSTSCASLKTKVILSASLRQNSYSRQRRCQKFTDV